MFRTPLHADVFTSYSWSANIVGRKKWLLFPPREEEHLRDRHGQLAYDVLSEELNDCTKYKMYDGERLRCLDVIQEAGEIMFVPSGWHHQVWNLVNSCGILRKKTNCKLIWQVNYVCRFSRRKIQFPSIIIGLMAVISPLYGLH